MSVQHFKLRSGRLHLLKGCENCSVPISCESNPDVISTPMQHKNSHRYMRRRLGFLYHGTLIFVSTNKHHHHGSFRTLSCATMRVMIGSEVPSWIAMLSVEQELGSAGEHLHWHGVRPYIIPAKGNNPRISALPQVTQHLRE